MTIHTKAPQRTDMEASKIEEMVNGYTKEAMLFKVGEGEMERHQRLQNYVVEALYQAHQAGIDEAVGRIVCQLKIDREQNFDGKTAKEVIDHLIKALQNNK